MQHQPQNPIDGCVLALGNFDGLHRGHKAVLQQTKILAATNDLTPTVLLFDVHPKQVLFGEAPSLLMTQEEKMNRLTNAGFSVVTVRFQDIQGMAPEAFVSFLKNRLKGKAVCCGHNYRFGKNAAGTAELLQTLCDTQGIAVYVVDDCVFRNEPVSSTRIRQSLESGDMEEANAMLGEPFSFCLPVVEGDKRGKKLGFPTINQYFPPSFVRPRAGVYASKVYLNDGWYAAVTNIGVRPTIDNRRFHSETHILGFSGDLYGQHIRVQLWRFLRDEQKFENLAALQAAMQNDARAAREVLKQNGTEKDFCESSFL